MHLHDEKPLSNIFQRDKFESNIDIWTEDWIFILILVMDLWVFSYSVGKILKLYVQDIFFKSRFF